MAKPKLARKARVKMQAEVVRRSLSKCLERAGFGDERIVVDRFGREIAAIVSVADLDKLEEAEVA